MPTATIYDMIKGLDYISSGCIDISINGSNYGTRYDSNSPPSAVVSKQSPSRTTRFAGGFTKWFKGASLLVGPSKQFFASTACARIL